MEFRDDVVRERDAAREREREDVLLPLADSVAAAPESPLTCFACPPPPWAAERYVLPLESIWGLLPGVEEP